MLGIIQQRPFVVAWRKYGLILTHFKLRFVAQLTKLNLSSQQVERELRDELASVVPKQVVESEREKHEKAQQQLVKYKVCC